MGGRMGQILRSWWLRLGSMLLCALLVAWGATAQEPDQETQARLGVDLYWQFCATCHVALPPAVLPVQTWQRLLVDPNHYGQQIQTPSGPVLQLIWNVMREGSRPLNQNERIPFRLAESRFFRALHPQVEFRDPVRVTGCIDCHPRAGVGDFVSLQPEWLSYSGRPVALQLPEKPIE